MDFNGNHTNGKVVYDLENSGYIMEEIQRLITPPNYTPELNTPKILLSNNKKAKSNNHEYCDSCLEGGELICCDKCPVSFHLQCCDPPFNENTVPLGNWVCHKCKAKEVILKYLDTNLKMQSTLKQSKCHPNPEQNISLSNNNNSRIYNIVPNNTDTTVETLKLDPNISKSQNNTKNITNNNFYKNPEKISRKRILNHQTPTDMSYAKRRILRKTSNLLHSQIQSPKNENVNHNNINNNCQNNLGFTSKNHTPINITELNTSTQENSHKNLEKTAKNEISPKINVDSQLEFYQNIHKTNMISKNFENKPLKLMSYETIVEQSEGWNSNAKYCIEKFPRYINYTLGLTREKEKYPNCQNQDSKTPLISENLVNEEWLQSLDTIVSRLKLGNPCEFRLPKYILTCPYKFPGLPKIQYTLPLITAMNTKSSKMETKINDNNSQEQINNFLPGKNFKRPENLALENPKDNFNKNKDKVPTYVNNRRKKVSPDSVQENVKFTQKTENCAQNTIQKINNSLDNFNNNGLNHNATLIKDVVTIKYGPNILNRTSNHKANIVNAFNTVNKTVSQICVLINNMSETKTIGTPTQEPNADQLIFAKTNLSDYNELHCKNKIPRCFVCTKSYISAPLIQCDYCPLYYHMDCLSPPLTCLSANLSWICPNHVENILEEKFLNSHETLTDRIAIWDLNIPYFAQYCNTVYGPKKINNFSNNKIITCKNNFSKTAKRLNKDDFNDKNVISILHLATMNAFFHKVKRRHPPFNLQREIALDFNFYDPLRKLENEFYFPDRQINQLNCLLNPKFGLFNVPEKILLDFSKDHIIVCNNDNHKSQLSEHRNVKNLLDKVNKNVHSSNDIRSLIVKLCTFLCNVKSEMPKYPHNKR